MQTREDDPLALISVKKVCGRKTGGLERKAPLCEQLVERRRHGMLTPAQHHLASANECKCSTHVEKDAC